MEEKTLTGPAWFCKASHQANITNYTLVPRMRRPVNIMDIYDTDRRVSFEDIHEVKVEGTLQKLKENIEAIQNK